MENKKDAQVVLSANTVILSKKKYDSLMLAQEALKMKQGDIIIGNFPGEIASVILNEDVIFYARKSSYDAFSKLINGALEKHWKRQEDLNKDFSATFSAAKREWKEKSLWDRIFKI